MSLMRCRTCCYPSTKPDLIFDATGQCSACTSYAKRATIDWTGRAEQLTALLDRFHGRVIVPSSGGKDSTYIALRMKELGADVTAVTATTCHLTAIGRRNLDNLARHVRTIEVTPNMSVRAKLNRLGLDLVGDISWPEHATIFSTPFRVARDTSTNLLMYGENPQAEYGGPMGSEDALQMTRRWVSEFGGFNGLRPGDFVGREGITNRDMDDYRLPSPAALEGIEAHFLGAYEPWDSHRNARVAEEAGMTGMHSLNQNLQRWDPPAKANYWPLENLDNAQTGIHDYLMFRKYGFGRGCSQISVDVRAGRISRDDALAWIAKQDGAFPNFYAGVYLEDVLDRIGLDRAALLDICDRFAGPHLR